MLTISPLETTDHEWVQKMIKHEWGDPFVVVHGEVYLPGELPGYKAVDDESVVGLITYKIINSKCEVITLNSIYPSKGISHALLNKVENEARLNGCQSCWIATTNDNLNALKFYHNQGYVITEVHPNAVELARAIKSSIPHIGENGIPIRDEIFLSKQL
ncbi:MAG: hypothetical protein FD147_276 [Chloroflexi bacterium]|nr:MAG: hypothetical protein FD147_276 [Chloroflexota bacterium]